MPTKFVNMLKIVIIADWKWGCIDQIVILLMIDESKFNGKNHHILLSMKMNHEVMIFGSTNDKYLTVKHKCMT